MEKFGKVMGYPHKSWSEDLCMSINMSDLVGTLELGNKEIFRKYNCNVVKMICKNSEELLNWVGKVGEGSPENHRPLAIFRSTNQ